MLILQTWAGGNAATELKSPAIPGAETPTCPKQPPAGTGREAASPTASPKQQLSSFSFFFQHSFFFNLLFSLCPTPSSSYLNLAEGLTSADEDDPVGVIVWLPAPGKQARHEGGCCF